MEATGNWTTGQQHLAGRGRDKQKDIAEGKEITTERVPVRLRYLICWLSISRRVRVVGFRLFTMLSTPQQLAPNSPCRRLADPFLDRLATSLVVNQLPSQNKH